MKNSEFLILQCIIVIFLSGCNRDSFINEEEVTLNINIGSLDKKGFPGDLIKEVTYLKLETNKECLIRNIDKIKFSNELIYILDRLSKSVFVFNMEGKFMKKYNHYGRGPGEYINLADFDISGGGNYIYMLDFSQYKVIKYSLENKLIKELKLEFGTTSFSCIDDNILVFYQGNRINPKNKLYNNDIVYLDIAKNKPLRGYFPAKYRLGILNYALYSSGEQLFYLPYSATGVYKIDNDGVNQFINFLGVNQIEEKVWNMPGREFIDKIHESDYHFNFRDFYVLEDIITFAFDHKGQYRIFYSVKSKKMLYGLGFEINDPRRLPGNFEIIGTYKDNFVSYFTPSYILSESYEIFPIYYDHPELNHDLIKLSKETSINDNPIIVFFKVSFD